MKQTRHSKRATAFRFVREIITELCVGMLQSTRPFGPDILDQRYLFFFFLYACPKWICTSWTSLLSGYLQRCLIMTEMSGMKTCLTSQKSRCRWQFWYYITTMHARSHNALNSWQFLDKKRKRPTFPQSSSHNTWIYIIKNNHLIHISWIR